MNERIKELMLKSGIYQPERFDSIDGSNQLERFAELIVRECIEHCKGQLFADKRVADECELGYNDGVMDCAIGLQQHFGVEE